MSKKVSSTAIGAFVVGGIVLLAAAVAIFGGKDLFAKKSEVVTYFDGSTKGLRAGSNVTFRGVRVGYVESIQLVMDVDTLESVTEVDITLMHNEMELLSKGEILPGGFSDRVRYDELIEAGLSAQLESESLVTGQLLINLDFRPELNPKMAELANTDGLEIPSVHSSTQIMVEHLENILTKLQKLDLEKLFNNLDQTLAGANALVNSPDLRESLAGVNHLINAPETQALTKKLSAAIDDLMATLDTARVTLSNVDAEMGPALDQLRETLAAAQTTLDSANEQIRSGSEFSYHLERTLEDVSDAARSLNTFLEMLDRNPESLIRGKK